MSQIAFVTRDGDMRYARRAPTCVNAYAPDIAPQQRGALIRATILPMKAQSPSRKYGGSEPFKEARDPRQGIRHRTVGVALERVACKAVRGARNDHPVGRNASLLQGDL